ncbi:mucin-5AC-like [Physella acuta]|uniref:mucin-5AC-like n=1 Tax=Physella acuta TaxID=109671 RepID=UPI0027DD7722|nr:mucin-5AC-like [Physella acuta]
MEVNKKDSQAFPGTSLESPSGSAPASLVHLANTAPTSVSLGASCITGSGCLLPVSLMSQPLVSSLQHQQLMAEPLLLVPTSALSLAPGSGFAPSPTDVQPSALHYSHQLLLNNAQLPLVLKPPVNNFSMGLGQALSSESQPIIVLPLAAPGNNLLTPDGALSSKAASREEQCVTADSTDQKHTEKSNLRRGTRRKSTKISALCSNRDNILSSQLNSRTKKNNETATRPSDLGGKNVSGPANSIKSDFLNTTSAVKNSDISQIISNLPSGWQVVGFTGLEQIGATLAAPLLTANSAAVLSPNTMAPSCLDSNKTSFQNAEIKPSLVSVNLNNLSQPVASRTYDNYSIVNELTCSVKLDDIPSTHIISMKAEQEDAETIPDSTSDSLTVIKQKEKLHSRKCKGNSADAKNENAKTESFSKTDKKINPLFQAMAKPCLSSTSMFGDPQIKSVNPPVMPDGSWTIIGVTSIPPLPCTSSAVVSQLSTGAATVTSSSSAEANENPNCDQSSDTIILKIPMCPSNTTSNRKKKKGTPQTAVKQSQKGSVAELLYNVNQQNTESNKSSEMKWTVVGLTQPVLNSNEVSTSSQMVSSSMLSLPNITQAGTAPLTSHMINKPLNLISQISSNQYLVQSPLSQPASSFDIPVNPGSSESPQFSSSPMTITSNDGINVSSCPTQSHWKVVGLTSLDVPASPVAPFAAALHQISHCATVPLLNLIPAASSLALSCVATTTTNSCSTVNSTHASLTAPFSPAAVINIAGSLSNPSDVSTPISNFTKTIQEISQQQNQAFCGNLALKNPLDLLKMNDPNQWNVVGLVSNNHVSMLDKGLINSLTPEILNHSMSPPTVAPQDLTPTSKHSCPQNPPEINTTDDIKKMSPLAGKATRRSLTLKSKNPENNSKVYQLKCRDLIKRQHVPTYMKKNTVSSLLRIKRMQTDSIEDDNMVDIDMEEKFTLQNDEAVTPRSKTRSLRSYAGNRNIFTKSRLCESNSKLSLRSGTAATTPGCNSAEETVEDKPQDQALDSPDPAAARSENNRVKSAECASVVVEPHSAARKRKLKIPRRMVAADIDYHPFDSSSDSN